MLGSIFQSFFGLLRKNTAKEHFSILACWKKYRDCIGTFLACWNIFSYWRLQSNSTATSDGGMQKPIATKIYSQMGSKGKMINFFFYPFSHFLSLSLPFPFFFYRWPMACTNCLGPKNSRLVYRTAPLASGRQARTRAPAIIQ